MKLLVLSVISPLALGAVLPLPNTSVEASFSRNDWQAKTINGTSLVSFGSRELTTFQLQDGNECQLQVVQTNGVGVPHNLNNEDWGNILDTAGYRITGSANNRQSNSASVSFQFTDHNGITHEVEASGTSTGETAVSVQGFTQNVGQAFVAAENYADRSEAGFPGTSNVNSVYMYVLFGSVTAISMAVQVLG